MKERREKFSDIPFPLNALKKTCIRIIYNVHKYKIYKKISCTKHEDPRTKNVNTCIYLRVPLLRVSRKHNIHIHMYASMCSRLYFINLLRHVVPLVD